MFRIYGITKFSIRTRSFILAVNSFQSFLTLIALTVFKLKIWKILGFKSSSGGAFFC